VEKHGTARQAADANIIRRMRFACWLTKATDTRSEYVIFIAFPQQNGYANASQYFVYTTFVKSVHFEGKFVCLRVAFQHGPFK
jgi:hypothetical protein